MTTQSQGRKKSQFIAQSTVSDSATFDFVINGTNRKITKADLVALFGVTGELQQQGDVTGVPILDKAGSVNNIRNLEAGDGVAVSVSAQNGAEISHNFSKDTTGAALVDDLTIASPVFRSLVAGAGINIAGSGDTIQISAPLITVASNIVVVNQMSDFPTPVAGVITLEDDTGYLVSASLSTSDRFAMGANSVVFGSDRFVAGLTYTGSGVMFTSSEVSFHVKDITLSVPNGTVFDASSTGSGDIFLFDNLTVATCNNLGNLNGMAGARLSNLTISNISTNGVAMSGNSSIVLVSGVLATVNGGALVDLGSATIDSISIISTFATLASGAFLVDGLASSGNINSGGLGAVTNSRTFGLGTPLNNISEEDARWSFAENNTIPDTRPDALISLTGNVTETVITAANTPVKVAGTWNIERSSQFTTDTTGRATYNGEKSAVLPCMVSLSSRMASGGSKSTAAYVAINGSIVANAVASNDLTSASSGRTTLPWQHEFQPGDYIEAWVENRDDTTNILVEDAILRVN